MEQACGAPFGWSCYCSRRWCRAWPPSLPARANRSQKVNMHSCSMTVYGHRNDGRCWRIRAFSHCERCGRTPCWFGWLTSRFRWTQVLPSNHRTTLQYETVLNRWKTSRSIGCCSNQGYRTTVSQTYRTRSKHSDSPSMRRRLTCTEICLLP